MAIIYFPAIVETGDFPGYSVFFPDLPGLASAGESTQEAAHNAEEALRGHLELMVEDGMAIPEPSALDRIEHDPEVREAARILVRAVVPSERVLRVNVTLPEDLVQRIDERTNNRSRFLAEAAEKLLERKRA
ncbi:MAG: type II toxin-antitoxin system HicB family antitoxin [Alphaproteobacteria bacterium]|nr:type II toxin-antitoxin system HicB family antitoxin [Alphaproteobacteria bacterium]